MTRREALALSLALASTRAAASEPQDYPQWRGQHRDGSASAFAEPSIWPKTLTQRWKVEVGAGYATPLVVGDSIYCFTRRRGDEVMTALDASTGQELWHTSYAAPYAPLDAAAAHGAGPKATPAFHDGKLFTLGVSGVVAAFDASSGRLLWRTADPPEPALFGAASSPVAEASLVITHPGNYDPLTAFDLETGAVIWTAGEQGFFSAPIVADLAGTRQVITMIQQAVIGVSLADGRLLWRYPWSGGQGGITPIVNDDTIIVSSRGSGVAAFKPTNSQQPETVWETKEVSMYISNPVVVADTLFGLSHLARNQYFALDAKTGEVLWLGPPRQADNTAVVKAGNNLFLLNDDSELIVAEASRSSFKPFRSYIVADSATWAQPVIAGSRIFVEDVSSLTLWTLD
ncbi:MAG: PQQ-like beta-propeller repeat protein [Acidobacteria bacterium]|nr:PQQ-like beta-propeller repeat protein [Acidobacteriota bacterium]MDA1234491.1 PQQ-like beta-propeller repeat protein [Acidobacteriota bacterium]